MFILNVKNISCLVVPVVSMVSRISKPGLSYIMLMNVEVEALRNSHMKEY